MVFSELVHQESVHQRQKSVWSPNQAPTTKLSHNSGFNKKNFSIKYRIFFVFQDYFFDRQLLTDGAPPNDRGCRACGKIGHIVADCPRSRQKKTAENRKREQEKEKDKAREQERPLDPEKQPSEGMCLHVRLVSQHGFIFLEKPTQISNQDANVNERRIKEDEGKIFCHLILCKALVNLQIFVKS